MRIALQNLLRTAVAKGPSIVRIAPVNRLVAELKPKDYPGILWHRVLDFKSDRFVEPKERWVDLKSVERLFRVSACFYRDISTYNLKVYYVMRERRVVHIIDSASIGIVLD
jgi:hypothetical protein